jgi:Flp pilus assembly protein TadD
VVSDQRAIDQGAGDPGPDVTILDSAQAHFARGSTASLLKNWPEALEAFEAAIAARPDYPEAWNLRGAVLHEMGEDEEALGCFEQALKLRPKNRDVHSNISVCLRMLNRNEEAVAAADRACLRSGLRRRLHDPRQRPVFSGPHR